METRINTIDRVISKDGLDDVCQTIHYTFYKEKEKTAAVAEVLYEDGDELPEGKEVGDVKTDEVSATYYSASNIGTVSLDSPDADNFTAYADVTEANAISWCKAKFKLKDIDEVKYEDGDDIPEGKEIGDVKIKAHDELASIEASLDAQIAEQETPTKGKGKPWS